MEKICKHCGGDIAIRNPSGYCDHLYYPNGCDICKTASKAKPTANAVEEKPCDTCNAQEGKHYCLLHSRQMKNMDQQSCEDWESTAPLESNEGEKLTTGPLNCTNPKCSKYKADAVHCCCARCIGDIEEAKPTAKAKGKS